MGRRNHDTSRLGIDFPIRTTSSPVLSTFFTITIETVHTPQMTAAGKKRGRPAKEAIHDEPPKKRGQPLRASALAEAVLPEDGQPIPRKRGCSVPVGETAKINGGNEAAADELEEELGKTAKISSDNEAAADHLEEELMDRADDESALLHV